MLGCIVCLGLFSMFFFCMLGCLYVRVYALCVGMLSLFRCLVC